MTEIKTAQAWGDLHAGTGFLRARTDNAQGIIVGKLPVVIVHGLTEAEVHEAAALLEKSREVCEWQRARRSISKVEYEETNRPLNNNCDLWIGYSMPTSRRFNYCPSCGRKVVVK